MPGGGSILVVCTGNVCRSPYIEARLRAELSDRDISVTSAGTGALVGRSMDPGSQGLLGPRAADMNGFRARQLIREMILEADLVIAAAREHRSAAARTAPAAMRKTLTLRDLADLLDGVTPADVRARARSGPWVSQVVETAISRRPHVPARQSGVDITDPIGRPPAVFAAMAHEIDEALGHVVPVLRGGPS